MIKFFRHIRQRLLSESKFSKYLIYAIGEIVLVVIGILIAIQLNEWRKDSIDSQQRDKVLQALKFEFQANLAQLDTISFYQNKIIVAYPKVMEAINKVNQIEDDANLPTVHADLGYTWSFDPINGALRSGISSGEIHLIENDRLLELLFSWEDVVADTKEESKKQKENQIEYSELISEYIRIGDLYGFYFPGTVPSRYPSDVRGLYQDVYFEDYTNHSFFNAFEYLTELDDIRLINLEILELIEEEQEQ